MKDKNTSKHKEIYMITNPIIAVSFIFLGRIFLDVFFLGKMDAFYKDDKLKLIIFGFLEAVYSVVVLSIVIGLMETHWLYSATYGIGAIAGIYVSSFIKKRLDKKLEGQRKFFVRVSMQDPTNLFDILQRHGFSFEYRESKYINGRKRYVIEGSIDTRERLEEMKQILQGRRNKHVTILRAEETYMLR